MSPYSLAGATVPFEGPTSLSSFDNAPRNRSGSGMPATMNSDNITGMHLGLVRASSATNRLTSAA